MMGAFGSVFGNEVNFDKIVVEPKEIFSSPIEKLKTDLRQLIKDNNYSSAIRMEESERGITIHILEEIVFPSGSADLLSSSQIVLKQLAGIIKKIPNDIRVEGHTDNIPINGPVYKSNWHLSVARALNTAYYLINSEGLSPDKVAIVGLSEYKPLDSNDSPGGRSLNRRVDIVIIK